MQIKTEYYRVESVRQQIEDIASNIQRLRDQLPLHLQDKLSINFIAAYTELTLLCAALYQELETYK